MNNELAQQASENEGALLVTTAAINQNNIASMQLHLALSKAVGIEDE